MQITKLTGITEYIKVVEAGSFAAAAVELNISRARVSQIIAELEHQLGIQLLQRSTRAMSLTDAGERFYHQALAGMTLLQQAFDSVKADQAQLSGKIRINSVGGMFAEQILTPLLCQFMSRYPSIDIELDFSSKHIGLIDSNYDLAIRMGELPDSNLIARPLARYKTYVCAAPAYLNQQANIVHPNELNRLDVISGSIRKWRFVHQADEGKSCEVAVNSRLSCANGHVGRTAALLGQGVIRAPAFYVEDDLEQGRLIALFKDWALADSKVSIVYSKSAYKARRIQVLIAFLLEQGCNLFSRWCQ